MLSTNGEKGIENRLTDKDWGDEGEGEMSGESSMEAYTLTYVNRWPMEIFYMTQRTQIGLCNNLKG